MQVTGSVDACCVDSSNTHFTGQWRQMHFIFHPIIVDEDELD